MIGRNYHEKMPKSNGVQVGKVTITVSSNSKKEFHIVSHLESDPSANKYLTSLPRQSPTRQGWGTRLTSSPSWYNATRWFP